MTRKTRLIFPITIIFLILYLLASPEKIIDKTILFRDKAPIVLPEVKEENFQPNKNPDKNYVPHQIIVKLALSDSRKIGLNPQPVETGILKLDILNARYRVTTMSALSSRDNRLRQVYRLVMEDQNIEEAVKDYQNSGVVEYAEPNYKARGYATNPNDPKFADGTQWSLNQIADHDINAPEGWDYETGSTETVIAIIDSGVDTDHPDLNDNIWLNAGESGGGKESNNIDDDNNGYIDDYQGWDWVTSYNNWPADNDPNPEPDGINNDGWYGTDDGVEHGTHVAGIAAAETNNNTGIAGVCWNCKIMALRVLDDEGWGSYYDIAQAIEYATDNGADVINMSLGGGYSNMLDEVIKDAYMNNVVVVAASGNSAEDLNDYLASPVGNDGDENRVIGVAGTNSSGSEYVGSNYGYNYVDVTAPGQSIYSTVYYNPAYGFNNYYEGGWTGTSMATPHVAGLAGLVKSANPTWTAAQVRNRILNLTKNIEANIGDKAGKLGSGLINLERALNSNNGIYPDGTIARRSGTNSYYILKNGQRRPINRDFRDKYHLVGPGYPDKHTTISMTMILNYPRGKEIRWLDGTLFKDYYHRNHIYILEDGKRRRFTSAHYPGQMGYDSHDMILTRSEFKKYAAGPNITNSSGNFFSGTVIKVSGDGNYYKIYNGSRYTYGAINYMKYYCDKPTEYAYATIGEKNLYPDVGTLPYPGGVLIGDPGNGNVYMIEYGKKRLFSSQTIVSNLGWSTAAIVWSASYVSEYAEGLPMPDTISSS